MVDYYTADIINAQDYYPFGSIMPGRNWSNEEYRFGFNGMEKDNEIKGEGNSLDFGARIYDSRLGRWMSLDPAMMDFPTESHYIYCSDNPVIYSDPDGKKKIITHVWIDQTSGAETRVSVVVSDELMSEQVKVPSTFFGVPLNNQNWTNEYDWYDINETVVHTVKDGKEVGPPITTVTKGAYRAHTPVNIELIADKLVDDGAIEDWNAMGGVNWTSSNGQGQETKSGSGEVQSENIDLLLATLGAANTAAGVSNTGEFLEGVKLLVDAYSTAKDLDENEITISDAIKKIQGQKSQGIQPKNYVCEFCGDTIPAQDTGSHPGPIKPVEPKKDAPQEN